MRHVIVGGDGFVGSVLARNLAELGETVIVADINQSPHAHYDRVPFVRLDVTDPISFAALPLSKDDMVYNLSARMLSPIMKRADRHDFF